MVISMKTGCWLGIVFCLLFAGCRISGQVVDEYNQPMQGVSVVLEGDATKTTTTDRAGTFVFDNLDAGRYTITPGMNGYTFQPESVTIIKEKEDFGGLFFSGIKNPAMKSNDTVESLTGTELRNVTWKAPEDEDGSEALCFEAAPLSLFSDVTFWIDPDAWTDGVCIYEARIWDMDEDGKRVDVMGTCVFVADGRMNFYSGKGIYDLGPCNRRSGFDLRQILRRMERGVGVEIYVGETLVLKYQADAVFQQVMDKSICQIKYVKDAFLIRCLPENIPCP
jgi:hypothetical protein